jgi:hypothetical protein
MDHNIHFDGDLEPKKEMAMQTMFTETIPNSCVGQAMQYLVRRFHITVAIRND